MEFAVIQLPRIGLLIHVRFEDADLVRLGNRNRCTAGNDNPVNSFCSSIRLKTAFLLPGGFPIVEYIRRLHAGGRYGKNRNFIICFYFGSNCTGFKVRRIQVLSNVFCVVQDSADRSSHNNNKRFSFTNNVLHFCNFIIQFFQHVCFIRRESCRFMGCAFCQSAILE